VNIAAMINNNQSSLNTSIPLIVKNYTAYSGFILFVSFQLKFWIIIKINFFALAK
jgi:hypothetical protein